VRFQPRSSRSIFGFLFGMLAAIHLDRQSMTQATEVDDVITDRMLTTELRTIEAFGAEILPKETFGGSLFAAEAANIGAELFWCAHNRKVCDGIS
jgi:hypothetical protein